MRTPSILGLIAALYLIADAAAANEGLSLASWLVAILAIAMTLSPLALASLIEDQVRGARRVASFGLLSGVLLAAVIGPPAVSMTRDLALVVLFPLCGVLLVDLALHAPDRAPEHRLRVLLVPIAVAVGVLGALDAMPAFELFGITILAPPSFLMAPPLFALMTLWLALVLRFRRRTWASAESLASNGWALLGLTPAALLFAYFAFVSLSSPTSVRNDAGQLTGAIASFALLYGHAAMVDPKRRLQAGPVVREVIAFVLPAGLVALLAFVAMPMVEDGTHTLVMFFAFVLALLMWRVFRLPLLRSLSPAGGRLLAACESALSDLPRSTDLRELGEAVLGGFRKAAGDELSPKLFTLAPPRLVTVDAAGTARVEHVALPEALEVRLAERPHELMVSDELTARMVRETEVRDAAMVLEGEEALCAVPLGLGDEVEGLLLVPRGTRRGALALEELEQLRRVGREIGARLALVGGRDRALARVTENSVAIAKLQEDKQALEEEVARLRAEARSFRSGRARSRQSGSRIAYSESARELYARLEAMAPIPGPITMVAEAGLPVDQIGRELHAASGRVEGPYVVADASAVRDEAAALLFGGVEDQTVEPGWLQLAEGGTLLLADLPALPLTVQRELAESLASKQARPAGGDGYYPVDLRVVATMRRSLDELVEDGAVDEEMARWLGGMCVRVPPLRERREDLPSFVLLALDRACRVLGREPVGISQEALEVLTAHVWPGNNRELQHVVEQAVARCEGAQVRRVDLPTLMAPKPEKLVSQEDPLDGTFNEVEARILRRAMRIAEGNKSKAARMLGLKRTTFLDKLRRSTEA